MPPLYRLDDGRVVSCVLYDQHDPLDGGDLTRIIGVTPREE